MKTIEFDIIKKGRVWFQCENENGYPCKLKINDITKELELGKHRLTVNDISVRSSYGTDLKYEAVAEITESSIVTFQHKGYNKILSETCRNLGGKFDKESASWIFSDIVEDKVEDLELLFNGDSVTIEITAQDRLIGDADSIFFCGYTVAWATGRDSGAKLGNKVSQINGRIGSCGSVKNWATDIDKDSVFRLKISTALLAKYRDDESWNIEVI